MLYDTLVIGGGIAGLQTAIQLGRSLRKVVVVDRDGGRSSICRKYRNILGYPEGISGETLLARGIEQARAAGVEFLSGTVASVKQRRDNLFEAGIRPKEQVLVAKTIVLAAGVDTPFPQIPGLGPCLGESIFICPDCDGFEVRGRHTAVIGSGPNAAEMALALHYFTDRLTVINHTGEAVDSHLLRELSAQQVAYREQMVALIEAEAGRMTAIQLASGERLAISRAFLAFPGAIVNTELLQPFHVQRLDNGHVIVDPRTKETSFRNIWAVGDVAAHSQQVTIAMGDGAQAAIWIHKRLFELNHGQACQTKAD